MQIEYSEEKSQYEINVSSDEKKLCGSLIEEYGFRWNEKTDSYISGDNNRSYSLVKIIEKFTHTKLIIPPKLTDIIREYIKIGNYNLEDIAIYSDKPVEKVRQTIVDMYSAEELDKLHLYDILIDYNYESIILACHSCFPKVENNVLVYMLAKEKIFVSNSCVSAVLKKNELDAGVVRQKQNSGKKTKNVSETQMIEKAPKEGSVNKQHEGKKNAMPEMVSVDTVKKEYYEKHPNCASVVVRKAIKNNSFDILRLADEANVKEDTIKCKLVELCSIETLNKLGYLNDFIGQYESTVMSVVNGYDSLPETAKIWSDIRESNPDITLSCVKTVLRKNKIPENVPKYIERPKKKSM